MLERNHNHSEAVESLVYDVPQAGALLGLNKNAAYAAAKRGDFPTIRIGKLIKVPKVAFHRIFERVINEPAE